MDIIQFIGFLISVLAILFIFGRHLWQIMYSQKHPEEYAEREEIEERRENRLQTYLRSLEEELEEEERPKRRTPPPKQTAPSKKEQQPYPSLASLQPRQVFAGKTRPIAPHPTTRRFEIPEPIVPITRVAGKVSISRIQQLMHSLKSPQDLIILSLILERPRSAFPDVRKES